MNIKRDRICYWEFIPTLITTLIVFCACWNLGIVIILGSFMFLITIPIIFLSIFSFFRCLPPKGEKRRILLAIHSGNIALCLFAWYSPTNNCNPNIMKKTL